jgi:hypothetical protein
MESILTRQEIKRAKAILAKQNAIKQKAADRRNLRILSQLDKSRGGPPPKLDRGVRIKDRHVLQILLGTLSERNLAYYNSVGVTRTLAEEIIAKRPALLAKYEAITLGMEAI